MQKIFENWRHFVDNENNPTLLNEAPQKWIKRADPRVINDVLRAAEDAGVDKFTTQLLLGFLKIESRGSAKYTFYNPDMEEYRGVIKRPRRVGPGKGRRPIGPFQILQGSQNDVKKHYGYDPGKFGDPYHQAEVVLKFIEKKRKKFGDDPARIYLSWQQGAGGSAAIYRALKGDPNAKIGDAVPKNIARNMRGNFSHRNFKRYGISNKNEITPQIFVDRYNSLFKGLMGDTLPEKTPEETPKEIATEKYVVVAGNSHSQSTKKYITDYYKNLEKETGTKYNIKYIGAPQGHGGEIKGQLARIKKLSKELDNKEAQVAAVIHIGTNFPEAHNFEKLTKEYLNLTNNVAVVGSPNPKSNYEKLNVRESWNSWIKQNQENLGIKYIETWGKIKDKDIKGDGVHLTSDGYKQMMDNALPQINFDNTVETSKIAGVGDRPTSGYPGAPSKPKTPRIRIGKFVHGFERGDFPEFDFKRFYDELDLHFKDKGGASGMLAEYGKDFKFGTEHHTAWSVLKDKKAALASTEEFSAETTIDPEIEKAAQRDALEAAGADPALAMAALPAGLDAPEPAEWVQTQKPKTPKTPDEVAQKVADTIATDYHRKRQLTKLGQGYKYTSPEEEQYIDDLSSIGDIKQGEEVTKTFTHPSGKQYKKKFVFPPPEEIHVDLEDVPVVPVGWKDIQMLQESAIKRIINEEYGKLLIEQGARWQEKDLIKVDVGLSYGKEFSFYGNVLNQIRAIKGITIAKADESGVIDVSPTRRSVLLHLKFMPDRPLSQYLYYLRSELIKIKDSSGDRIMNAETKNIPQKIEI